MKQQGRYSTENWSPVQLQRETECAPLDDEQRALLDDIGELRASTIPGQRARARVLLAWYGIGNGNEHECSMEWEHLGPLFDDLLRESM